MAQTCDRDKNWIRKLVVVFLQWKAILLILAVLCPHPGYDTSGLILLDQTTTRHQTRESWWQYERIVLNLLRWDALYFVKGAERSKVYEQEWAFSWAYSRLLRCVGQLLSGNVQTQTWHYVVAGFLISNLCHLLSSLVLFRLLARTMGQQYQYRLAFVAAVLHVLTPASLFMSAPYAEPIFSLLNFAGMLHYVNSQAGLGVREDLYKLSSGLLFGLATLMRSNGLLSGLILVYDVAQYVPRAVSMRLTMQDMRRLIITGLAGILVAIGYILPQYLAYNEYCAQPAGLGKPLWCSRKIPSIYTWVQSHYWNVGLFRYWTFPNLPLFLMAAPMLWLLFQSSVTVLRSCPAPSLHGRSVRQGDTTVNPKNVLPHTHMVPELAIPQLVLTIAALTSFHVQIVNRIASGYPTWYVLIAKWIAEDQNEPSNPQRSTKGRWAVRIMVTYVITQGMLYANFLPPA